MFELVFIVFMHAGAPGVREVTFHKSHDACWDAGVKKTKEHDAVRAKGGGTLALCHHIEVHKEPKGIRPALHV